MTRLAAEHREPVAGQPLAAKKRGIEKKLSSLLASLYARKQPAQITIGGIKRPLGDLTGNSAAGAPSYTELVHSQLEQLRDSATQHLAARKAVIEAINQYQNTLTAYVQFLAKIKAKIVIVRMKLDSPPDIRQSAVEILGAVTTLRTEFASFREARRVQ